MTIKRLCIGVLLAILLINIVSAVDMDWVEVNSSAFPARYWHGQAVNQSSGSIVILGGFNGTDYLSDVYKSTDDGTTFSLVNASAPWGPLAGMACEYLPDQNKIYVAGGINGTAGANNTYSAVWTIWETADDGSTWSLTTDDPDWKGTYAYYGDDYGLAFMGSTVSADSEWYLTGGYTHLTHTGARNLTKAVWATTTPDTWAGIGNLPTYVLNGYQAIGYEKHRNEWMSIAFVGGRLTTVMYPAGAFPTAGTAYSAYGTLPLEWTTRTTTGYWTPRIDFGSAYISSKLILFGGYCSDSLYRNDVWGSQDEGTTWSQYSDADWSIRMGLASTELNTTHVLISGGYGPTGALGDVWVGTLNSTATSDYDETTDGYGIMYPPHSVRFTFVNEVGSPITDATVTATPVETSLGAWGWLSDIFGFDDDVDVGGSTLTGTTGADGTVSFMMIPEIRYSVNIVKASASINQTVSIFPKEGEYFLRIGNLPYVENYPVYNLTVTEVNATHARLAMAFNDTANQTTGMHFYVYDINGTEVYNTSVTLTAGVGTAHFDVNDTRGLSYRFGFNGTNTDHGNVSAYQGVDMKGSGKLIDYGWPDVWYIVIALGVIFLIAGAMGETDVRVGAVLVPIFAGLFWYIGWLPDTLGVIINVLFFLGVIYYMRGSMKAVDT